MRKRGGTDDGSRHERRCGQRDFLPVDPSTVLALWVQVWR
jgi:hypothetical protein